MFEAIAGVCLLLFLYGLFRYSSTSYKVTDLSRVGPRGWRATVVVTTRGRDFTTTWCCESWPTWINEDTFEVVSHNWAGGEEVAYYLNRSVYDFEAQEAVSRMQSAG